MVVSLHKVQFLSIRVWTFSQKLHKKSHTPTVLVRIGERTLKIGEFEKKPNRTLSKKRTQPKIRVAGLLVGGCAFRRFPTLAAVVLRKIIGDDFRVGWSDGGAENFDHLLQFTSPALRVKMRLRDDVIGRMANGAVAARDLLAGAWFELRMRVIRRQLDGRSLRG